MKTVIGSIVVFNPKLDVLKTTISTFLTSSPDAKVYIWDNSPEDKVSSTLLKEFSGQLHYYKSPGNLGYGRGHNEIFKRVAEPFDYFCILNPDLEIPPETIPTLVNYLDSHPTLGLASCLIKGTDGAIHEVHKLLPSFWDYIYSLALRFLKVQQPLQNLVAPRSKGGPFALPILSGCFMFFSKDHYKEISGFDDSFFLYFEDYDISLRSFLKGKSIILPNVHVVHKWARDSHRNWRLFWIHLKSGLRFYYKWGLGSKLAKKVNSLMEPHDT